MLKRALCAFAYGLAAAALILGIAYLVPLYDNICTQGDKAGQKYCSVFNALFSGTFEWLDAHGVGITALATAIIAVFTATLWRATTESLSHSRQVERAYVSADAKVIFRGKSEAVRVGHIVAMPELPTDPWLSIILDNNGKTAAFVDEIAVVVCDFDALPPKPDYSKSERLADLRLTPGAREIRTFGFDMRTVGGKIVYGRVYYTDIYNQRHSSGFIRHILSSMAISVEASKEYTAWD